MRTFINSRNSNCFIIVLSSLSYPYSSFIYFEKYKIKLNSRNTIFGSSTNDSRVTNGNGMSIKRLKSVVYCTVRVLYIVYCRSIGGA